MSQDSHNNPEKYTPQPYSGYDPDEDGWKKDARMENKHTIVCYYIECKDQAKLEKLLQDNGYAFYDATDSDCYSDGSYSTLDEIEADIEGK